MLQRASKHRVVIETGEEFLKFSRILGLIEDVATPRSSQVSSMSHSSPSTHRNAESFFQLLKRERIKRKIYTTRQDARDARDDVFDYIEMFYNPKRRHSFNNQLSPVEFEKRYAASLESV